MFSPFTTQRADFFNVIASDKERLKIAGIIEDYKPEINKFDDEMKKVNAYLHISASIAFDEGYRKGMAEQRNQTDAYIKDQVKIKNRKKGELHYVTNEEITDVMKIASKRFNSKRMRKRCIEDDGKTNEEFMLAMVINTAFECGYLKTQDPNEIIKIHCGGDSQKEELMHDLFTSILGSHKLGENKCNF